MRVEYDIRGGERGKYYERYRHGANVVALELAEKLAALRTAQYFQDRAARADLKAFDRLLTGAGEEPPRPGDEIEELAPHARLPQRRKPRRQPQVVSKNETRPSMTKLRTRDR